MAIDVNNGKMSGKCGELVLEIKVSKGIGRLAWATEDMMMRYTHFHFYC